jgi:hypothetical protein
MKLFQISAIDIINECYATFKLFQTYLGIDIRALETIFTKI